MEIQESRATFLEYKAAVKSRRKWLILLAIFLFFWNCNYYTWLIGLPYQIAFSYQFSAFETALRTGSSLPSADTFRSLTHPIIVSNVIYKVVFVALLTFTIVFYLWKMRNKTSPALGSVTLVELNRQNSRHLVLENIASEISIAAGLPVPDLKKMTEPGINSAGFLLNGKALLVVTETALMALDRDELQSLVAHEIGHFIDEDRLLDCQIDALISALFMSKLHLLTPLFLPGSILRCFPNYYLIKLPLSFFAVPASLLIYIIVLPLRIVFKIFDYVRGGLLRQREYFADALAIELTRQSSPLKRVLEKVLLKENASTEAKELDTVLFAPGGAISAQPPIESRLNHLKRLIISDTEPEALAEFQKLEGRPFRIIRAILIFLAANLLLAFLSFFVVVGRMAGWWQ